ncbi:MAG: hypothetical protein M1546_12315 [Chloroflexi bacterium]|nr:hypothetical protein [Chloroflexota bacterium]
MLDVLYTVEKELPILLQDEGAWKSLYVDYHPPIVERLWLGWREYRVNLHRIHPCGPGEALFHPHPWPSAMRVLVGEYEMAVGYGQGDTPPPIAVLMIASTEFCYEMTEPDAWHYVRPIGGPTLSLMVTGKPWERWSPRSEKPLHPLSAEQRDLIFRFFRARYP